MPKDILIAEHKQLFKEIRFIIDKITLMYKFYIGLFTSLILYILAGINFYIDKSSDLTQDIIVVYSILGILLTGVLYIIGHIASRQYAVSKKHRVRYWKAIHAVRKGFINICPQTKDFLIMPIIDSRPNISPGEISTPYIFGLLNILFASIMFWFIYIWTSLQNNKIIFTISSFENAIKIFMLFLFITMLLLPVNCAYYSRQLYVARKIRNLNPFPEYYGTDKGKLLKHWNRHWVKYTQPFIVAFIFIFYGIYHIYTLYSYNHKISIYDYLGIGLIIVLIICNNAAYMYPYFKPKTIKRYCKYNIMPCMYKNKYITERCFIDRHCIDLSNYRLQLTDRHRGGMSARS